MLQRCAIVGWQNRVEIPLLQNQVFLRGSSMAPKETALNNPFGRERGVGAKPLMLKSLPLLYTISLGGGVFCMLQRCAIVGWQNRVEIPLLQNQVFLRGSSMAPKETALNNPFGRERGVGAKPLMLKSLPLLYTISLGGGVFCMLQRCAIVGRQNRVKIPLL